MKKYIHDVLFVILGNIFIASSVRFFVIPYSILTGGLAGISVALYPLLHIPQELLITILTWALFIIGALFLGKPFAVKTILSAVVYPSTLYLLNLIPITIEVDPILASVYSGILAGIGVALTFKVGASTGGMDIPPLIIHKLTNIPLATLVMITDALTVLLGMVTYGIPNVLLGLISVYTSGVAIDKIITLGGNTAKQFMIISSKPDEIRLRVMDELERGVTVLEGRGGYTNEKKEVLIVVVPDKQYTSLMEILDQVDPDAFIISNDTREIRGEGFSYFRL